MKTGWTGGQYSVYRAVFGTYLFFHFVTLIPWGPELFSNAGALPDASASPLYPLFPNVLFVIDNPSFVVGVLILGAAFSFAFAIGFWDRVAAVCLWYIWACLHSRMPLIVNPGMPYVGWLLLAHACLPGAPYGSWSARGRPDPGGGWQMTPGIWAVGWILMAVGYSYSGVTKLTSPSWLDGSALERVLNNPLARPGWARDLMLSLSPTILRYATWSALALEIGFAPLALFRVLRPWLWLSMLLMHVSLILVIDFADLSFGMVIVHFFTLNPGWIRPANPQVAELVFYDGSCGLCHRAVRFILAEDATGAAFHFAPLDSETFRRTVPESRRAALPDTFVVLTADGKLLTRSTAVRHILKRLGGIWRILAVAGAIIPNVVADAVYDGVARIRTRLFAPPATNCPVVPSQMRERFAV